MTDLRFLSLGFAPRLGKHAIDDAIRFKTQLRAVLPFTDNAYLVISPHEDQRCEVKVAYELSAKGWAEKALGMSEEVWDSMAVRRKETVRE